MIMQPDNLAFTLPVIFGSFIASVLLTGWIKNILQQHAVLDIPNDRSSHKTPIPRGGGWALIIVLIPALVGYIFLYDGDMQHVGLIVALVLLAAISWLDDRHHVNPALRLSIHILASYLGTLGFTPQETLLAGNVPLWLDRIITILVWAWFINLYNFMDGIDGMTGVETISIVCGLILIANIVVINDPFLDFLTLILSGVSLGFLVHNWHPAKIFMGDIGSIPLGYLVGFGLVTMAVKGYHLVALILPLYYLADSGITIISRACRGEKVWQAHRQHFYQYASIGTGRHDTVVVWVMCTNAGLIATAILSLSYPKTALGLSILVVAVLLQKMHKTKEKTATQI